jgi:hypothetical protein
MTTIGRGRAIIDTSVEIGIGAEMAVEREDIAVMVIEREIRKELRIHHVVDATKMDTHTTIV